MAAFVATRWDKPAAPATWRPMTLAAASAPAPTPARRAAPSPPPPAEEPAAPAEGAPSPGPDLQAEIERLGAELAAERAAHAETGRKLEEAAALASRNAASLEAEADRLRQVADGLVATRRRLVEELREAAGVLVLAGARKLAGEGLRTQPGLVEALVDDAVAMLGRDGLVVRVGPGDVDRVTLALTGSGAQIVADTTITGGCFAATPFGAVDATVQTAAAALQLVVERWQTAGWRSDEDT